MPAAGRAGRSARDSAMCAPLAANANGFARAQVADLQRMRILSATFDAACDRGVGNVTVAHVVERSGVSRRTFYEHFSDREDCFLVAFDEALKYASERVLPAYRSESCWRERIRAGLVALLSFIDEEPVIGRFLICESLAGRPDMLKRRAGVLARVTSAIEEGSVGAKVGFTSPPLTGEAIVGGVLAVIQRRLMEIEPDANSARGGQHSIEGALTGIPKGHTTGSLVELANPLMSMIVLPYLGQSAARRELERAAPAGGGPRDGVLLSNPFKDAGMRLTYRTVRVLMAVAEHPCASNRLVGDTAEIKDQGQISKLLGRLERNGMLSNTGLAPGQGAPNSWRLTPAGRQVVNSIRAHTERPSHGARER
jgi:AcrR family transcriptional regulator/DNA-binding MarR family transcriptional regulator